jgi:hypothetical protein
MGPIWLIVAAMALHGANEAPVIETTLGDQTGISVTAYNSDLALVRDVRKVTLPTGELHLRFSDVAQQIRPETVSLLSASAANSVGILEQNYEFDLMTPNKLLDKFVGKEVELMNFDAKIGFTKVAAELLSVNEKPVYEINGQVVLDQPGTVVLPKLPENLVSKPALVWMLKNNNPNQTLEATYLTGGISWKADYVATLAKDEKSLDLSGWVTMDNKSGATYSNAALKLVAGDVNIVKKAMAGGYGGGMTLDAIEIHDKVLPREESFGEYHLYAMPRRTTIKDNESKQLALLAATGVSVSKKYEFRGSEQFYSAHLPEPVTQPVGVFYEFENKEANHLGMPLPAGVMRLYQEDSEGAQQFSGEDQIKHTPKDEKVTLHLGNAFDVVGERIQTEFKTIVPTVNEISHQITLRNHKDKDVTVDVVEPMPENWQITKKSMDFEKKDARTALFQVSVPKDGETQVTYTVRVSTLPIINQKNLLGAIR